MMPHEEEFGSDLLRGAGEIAYFFFKDRKRRREIYHLVATSRLPVFKLGSMICARRSVLLMWVQDQEERHAGSIRGKPADRDSIHPCDE
jgi:hypothetical protein